MASVRDHTEALAAELRGRLVERRRAEAAAGAGRGEGLAAAIAQVGENGGHLGRAGAAFASEVALRDTIERVLAPLGRRVDELNPMADARLPDGSRVNVVIPPLAVDGPALSIRRFTSVRPDPETLVASGTL